MVSGRLGAIELKAVAHHLTIPVSGNTGRLTGTRVHTPIAVQKEFDKTTPVLFRALCENQTLKSATIKMYQIDDAGIEREYFNIILAWFGYAFLLYVCVYGYTRWHINKIVRRNQKVAEAKLMVQKMKVLEQERIQRRSS